VDFKLLSSGVESGVDVAEKEAEQGFAPSNQLDANSNLSSDVIEVYADSCELVQVCTNTQSGEGGKLTTPFL